MQLSDRLREYLAGAQGRVVNLRDLRAELKVNPEKPEWETLAREMRRLVQEKMVRPSGRNDGFYKVVTQVKPVRVFVKDRERRPPFRLFFPKDVDAGEEMSFAGSIVIREGDLVTIGGVSNSAKTTLSLNFCGENIDYFPILLGNEFTTRIGDTDEYEPTPRFLNRLDAMDWVEWVNGNGGDKFTLLPVSDDYAEHIVKDKINIIDWVNLDASRLYDISKVMEDIKKELGRGIAIVILQKGEVTRGGQFVKDFTDCELILDRLTEREVMLTIGKVKEYTQPVMGRKFAFGIFKGVKIINFREIEKCKVCWGKGWKNGLPCQNCDKIGYVDVMLI